MGENVEFWLTFRSMSYYSNYNRSIFIHTLFEGCVNCLFQGQPYLSRCELRLTIAHIPCKWRQVFLYVSFSPCGAGTILWLIYLYTHLKYWSYYSTCSDGNGISRVRAPVRANIILGGDCYYELSQQSLLLVETWCREYGEGLQWIMQHSPGFFPFTLYCLLLLREWRESPSFFSIRQGETTH